jgi:hypothetical protein
MEQNYGDCKEEADLYWRSERYLQSHTEGGQCQCHKIRRETSGIPREAWDPNLKEEGRSQDS